MGTKTSESPIVRSIAQKCGDGRYGERERLGEAHPELPNLNCLIWMHERIPEQIRPARPQPRQRCQLNSTIPDHVCEMFARYELEAGALRKHTLMAGWTSWSSGGGGKEAGCVK
eukprot:3934705-Rhodomonas_salina.3